MTVKNALINDHKCLVSLNLTRFMKERNISRRQLSNDLNIKYTTLCDWINGNSTPRTDSLSSLAGYFGVDVSDFFIDVSEQSNPEPRLCRYKEELTLSLNTTEHMTDAQIRELIKRGFTFKHKTLEERVAESGRPLVASEEFDWGPRLGDEIW